MKHIDFFSRALDIFIGCNHKGWDSYNAEPVSNLALANALSLYKMLPNNIYEPAIVPCVDGNVQLEWNYNLIDFEIVVSNTNLVHCSFVDGVDGEHFNKDIILDDNDIPEDILLCLRHFAK